MYGGFNTVDAVNTISLLAGFLVIFTGVYLLNISRTDPDGHKLINGTAQDGIATDMISSIQTRRSMQARRSLDPNRMSLGSNYGRAGDREGLIRAYDEEENMGFGLTDLAEDTDGEEHAAANGKANGGLNGTAANGNGRANRKNLTLASPIERSRSTSRGSRVPSPR